MLEPIDQIDFNELYGLLLEASRKAFREIQETRHDETFYMFGLYYKASETIVPVCNSEEALMRHRNLTDFDRENKTLEWFSRRWSTSVYVDHHLEALYLGSVTQWIRHNLRQFNNVGEEEEIAIWTIIEDAVGMICLKVLQTLDREKVFGQGDVRERVVLNVVIYSWLDFEIHDQSHVHHLNSIAVYKRWRVEYEMHRHARSLFIWSQRFERPRTQPPRPS